MWECDQGPVGDVAVRPGTRGGCGSATGGANLDCRVQPMRRSPSIDLAAFDKFEVGRTQNLLALRHKLGHHQAPALQHDIKSQG